MTQHLRLVVCSTCRFGVVDHRPHALTEEHADEIERLHLRYWGNVPKTAETIRDYQRIYDAPYYANVRKLILDVLDRIEGPISIIDFGAGPGCLILFLKRERPAIIPRLRYIASEPTADFQEPLRQACEGVNATIITEAAQASLDSLSAPCDLFIATGALCYVRPSVAQSLLFRVKAKSVVLRDWFGLTEADPLAAYFLHNPTFPMFAHNWRRLLKERGYTVAAIEPSIWNNDGHGWHVALATL